ncbi:hypothetical protein Tdes44962_MAKER05244 [Teratosphaeria destructans]|uniref:Uncharacterized protein n=1 Tax=Teratosphaeria destructans TaxID=418781 RepID=A0A9W7SKE7_9PEZI|nr:hypothetical protein Tdes44962_MAKER05244 [Teratosphaeria destructans]
MQSSAAMYLPQEADADFFENVKYVRYMADAYLREAKFTFAELYKQHNDEVKTLRSRCEERAAECERLAGELGNVQSEKAKVAERQKELAQLHETAEEMLCEEVEKMTKKDEEIEKLKAELQLQNESSKKALAQKDEELIHYYDEEVRREKEHAEKGLEKLAEEKELELQELTKESWNLQSRVSTYERENERLENRVRQLEQAAKSCTCRKQPPHQSSNDDDDDGDGDGDGDGDQENNDHGAKGPEESGADEGDDGGESDEADDGGEGGEGGESGDGTEATHHGPNQHHDGHPDGQDQAQSQGSSHGQPAVVNQNGNPVMNQRWWENCGLQADVKDKMALDWARRNPEAAAQRVEGFGTMSNRRRILIRAQQKLAKEILEARR